MRNSDWGGHEWKYGGEDLRYFTYSAWLPQERLEWRALPPMERNRLSGPSIDWWWSG